MYESEDVVIRVRDAYERFSIEKYDYKPPSGVNLWPFYIFDHNENRIVSSHRTYNEAASVMWQEIADALYS